ncbi:MAG: hypothetical protein IKU03_10005 [Bacteroidales bacterium]|nr:hypothetical protein [Bacteroidales bacterium]
MKKVFIVCASFLTLFVSCNYVTPIEEVEDMLGVKLRGKIKYIEKQEQWMFGGDGCKIETFKVMDSLYIANIMSKKGQHYESEYVEHHYANSELYPFIKQTTGFYIEDSQNNAHKQLFYDEKGGKMVYFIVIF